MNTGAGWSNLDPLCNIGLCNIELDAYCETVGIVQGSKTGKWQRNDYPMAFFSSNQGTSALKPKTHILQALRSTSQPLHTGGEQLFSQPIQT
jgi:hypothetical protein